MSLGSFFLGFILLAVGFLMVWKRYRFREYFGDIGELLGYYNASWLGWPLVGIVTMVAGFLLMLGLFDLFVVKTIGRFLKPTI